MNESFTKIEYLEKELERLLNWIQASESKINVVTTFSITMLSVLAIIVTNTTKWNCGSIIFTSFSAIIILLSLLFTTLALFPVTKGPKDSLIYFGEINKLELDIYKKQVNELNEQSYMDDLTKQCYRNAQIATKKYYYVKRALFCLFISFIPWLISLYLLYNN